MLSDQQRIDFLTFTYMVVVRDKFENEIAYYITPFENSNSPVYQNALAFFDVCVTLAQPIYDFMRLALDIHGENWCSVRFHRPYLPFKELVSVTVRQTLQESIQDIPKPYNEYVRFARMQVVLQHFDAIVIKDFLSTGIVY